MFYLLLVLVITIWGYHNDGANLFFQKSLNTRIKQYFSDLYSYINGAAQFLTLKVKFFLLIIPADSNIVNLTISKKMNALIEREKNGLTLES